MKISWKKQLTEYGIKTELRCDICKQLTPTRLNKICTFWKCIFSYNCTTSLWVMPVTRWSLEIAVPRRIRQKRRRYHGLCPTWYDIANDELLEATEIFWCMLCTTAIKCEPVGAFTASQVTWQFHPVSLSQSIDRVRASEVPSSCIKDALYYCVTSTWNSHPGQTIKHLGFWPLVFTVVCRRKI